MQVEDIAEWTGQDVVDVEGDKIGKLEEVYAEVGGTQPVMGAVKVGLIGAHHHLVPLTEVSLSRGYLRVPFTKEQVTSAPEASEARHVSRADEIAFARHYGFTVAEGDDDLGSVRYESSEIIHSRLESMAADRQRADAIEAEARQLEEEADAAETRATESATEAREKRARRGELLDEVARLRGGTSAA